MKRRSSFTRALIAAAALALTLSLGGCFGGSPDPEALENVKKHLTPPPKNWFEDTLDYYVHGQETNWADAQLYGDLPDEIKDPNNRFGYYLVDLNGDKTKELLIGYADDTDATRFTDLWIYHPDFGPTHSFSNGDGYYLYLCEGNVLRNDSWYGSETETTYMTMDRDPVNGFPIEEFETPPKALACRLVPFDGAAEILAEE